MIEVIKRIYFFEKIIKFVCECNRRNQLLKGCSEFFFFFCHARSTDFSQMSSNYN